MKGKGFNYALNDPWGYEYREIEFDPADLPQPMDLRKITIVPVPQRHRVIRTLSYYSAIPNFRAKWGLDRMLAVPSGVERMVVVELS